MANTHEDGGKMWLLTVTIVGALITGLFAWGVPFIENILDKNKEAPVIPGATRTEPAPKPKSEFSIEPLTKETKANPDTAMTCVDFGPYTAGTACITPASGNPGDSFVVPGDAFPPNDQLTILVETMTPQSVTTTEKGSFSTEFQSSPTQCRIFMVSVKQGITTLGNLSYETTGC